ncbi:MAG: lipoate--protein ligase family protein [Ignavibacteriaceae bacterium]
MKWHFINSGAGTGNFNMDFDFLLAKNSKPDEAIFRLYQWKPFCISLGANQNLDSINSVKAQHDGIDIVKRPTGGRAILHAEELTYSVIYPVDNQTSARNIYHEINLALKKGLRFYDERLSFVELENSQPDFSQVYKEEISSICFAVSAKSELKFLGKKLVGSAQRKLGNAILQHGSILCGDYHKKVIEYLNLTEENILTISKEIDKTTTDLRSILSSGVDYVKLESALIKGFQDHFQTIIKEFYAAELIKNKNEIIFS